MRNPTWPLLALLWLGLTGAAAQQAVPAKIRTQPGLNQVQALDYGILAGGRIIVKLVFRDEPRRPAIVLVNHHPASSIVLDFADTASALGKEPVEVKHLGVQNLQVMQVGSRARLVIVLDRPLVHEIAVKGKELWITLQRPDAASLRAVEWGLPETASGDAKRSLREVTFQRGESSQGRLMVELTDPATPVEIRQQGKTLLVDFLDSALPAHLQRRLDVQDFGTPIRAVETYRLGNGVRMKIELEEAGEYTAYQVNRQLVVSPR